MPPDRRPSPRPKAANTMTPTTTSAQAAPASGTAPLQVSFTSTGSADPDGTIASYSWDFGDGNTSTDQNPVHTYTTSGDFDVELVATGPGGFDTMTAVAYVSVTEGVTAGFSPSVTTGTAPLSVDFTDLSTGSPTAWYWDFGDTGTDVVQNPTHVYTTGGTYTVMLISTDINGCMDTSYKTIQVNDSQFTASKEQRCERFFRAQCRNFCQSLTTRVLRHNPVNFHR